MSKVIDNIEDIASIDSKAVLTTTQTALDLKAPLASPALTGTPTAPTPTAGDSSTKIATTAFVINNQKNSPSYENGVSRSYNTVYQVSSPCILVVTFEGTYMNGIQVLVGSTSSPSTQIAKMGDDINSNAKAGSFHIPLKSGTYFKVAPYTVGGSGGYAFETVSINTYDFN